MQERNVGQPACIEQKTERKIVLLHETRSE